MGIYLKSRKKIKDFWNKMSNEFGYKLTVSGLDALASFSIDSKDWIKYKTYITQEMLSKNFFSCKCCIHVNFTYKYYIK